MSEEQQFYIESGTATSQVAMPVPPPVTDEGEQVRVLGMKCSAGRAEQFSNALDTLGWTSQRDWLRACIDSVIQQAASA